MVCPKHAVECFAIQPQWRDRPAKVSAGREDEFLLKQSDGLYAAPGSGSAPFDGRLVIADSVHVSDSRRNLLDRFKERGELILAARAPQSALEKIADGSPAYVCYKIECKKRNASEDPSTSKRKKRNAS